MIFLWLVRYKWKHTRRWSCLRLKESKFVRNARENPARNSGKISLSFPRAYRVPRLDSRRLSRSRPADRRAYDRGPRTTEKRKQYVRTTFRAVWTRFRSAIFAGVFAARAVRSLGRIPNAPYIRTPRAADRSATEWLTVQNNRERKKFQVLTLGGGGGCAAAVLAAAAAAAATASACACGGPLQTSPMYR